MMNSKKSLSKRCEIKGLVIAGTKSGCGKTTIALGLLAALTRRGLRVAPFKVGPDFIDPGHHGLVTGRVSRNLDGWMLPRAYNRQCFRKYARQADVAVVEGVMGLFDGYDGQSEAGSTAQMAKWLKLSVVLLVDAGSMARSAAALVAGFEQFDPRLVFAGVIFNNLASRRHWQYLKDALAGHVRMACLGGIPRSEDIAIPHRHLGLVTREDHPLADKTIARLADLIEENIDLDALLAALPDVAPPAEPSRAAVSGSNDPVRVAVARDSAFCFYYADNLDLLQEAGAELVFFSPLRDQRLPAEVDGLYLGGGYPELSAGQLSGNGPLRAQLRQLSRRGLPIYAECGGFMYLCAELHDQHGQRYPMCGCFPFATAMAKRLKALGYREITLTRDTVIGNRGRVLRGHEFHYSELTRPGRGVQTAYRVTDRSGLDKPPGGYLTHRTLGSYLHLHFGSQPGAAAHFVGVCRDYRRERETHP